MLNLSWSRWSAALRGLMLLGPPFLTNVASEAPMSRARSHSRGSLQVTKSAIFTVCDSSSKLRMSSPSDLANPLQLSNMS